MKAFVFKPSNAFVGKFDVSSTDQVAEALMRFGESHPLSSYDYIECSGKTWTLMTGVDGLDLVDGRQDPPKSTSSSGSSTSPVALTDVSARYHDAYTTAGVISGIGGVIKGIGIVFGIILVLLGLVVGSNGSGFDRVVVIFGCLITGILGGIILYVTGVLISAQGQILKATLDSAVHSSPFLTDAQRALVMRLKL